MAALIAQATHQISRRLSHERPDGDTWGGDRTSGGAGFAGDLRSAGGHRDHLFGLRLDRDAYGPGDEVTGRVTATATSRAAGSSRSCATTPSRTTIRTMSTQFARSRRGRGRRGSRFTLLPARFRSLPSRRSRPWFAAFSGFVVQFDQRSQRDHQIPRLPAGRPCNEHGSGTPATAGQPRSGRAYAGFDGQIAVDRHLVPLALARRNQRPSASRGATR